LASIELPNIFPILRRISRSVKKGFIIDCCYFLIHFKHIFCFIILIPACRKQFNYLGPRHFRTYSTNTFSTNWKMFKVSTSERICNINRRHVFLLCVENTPFLKQSIFEMSVKNKYLWYGIFYIAFLLKNNSCSLNKKQPVQLTPILVISKIIKTEWILSIEYKDSRFSLNTTGFPSNL